MAKKYELFKDSFSGLWYAAETGKSLGVDWRKKAILLGYPKKDAVAKACEMGLITKKCPRRKK
jgi:hypothetical protein